MSEKVIAGLLGALGLGVVLAAALFTAGSFFSMEDPVSPISAVDDEEIGEENEEEVPVGPPPERVVPGPRVIDPSLDDTDHLNITYEKLKAALDQRDFMGLKRLVMMAQGRVDPQFVQDLVALLEEKPLSFNVGTVLGMVKTPGTVEVLYRFLLETESTVARRAGVQAMARGGGVEAVPRLLDLMRHGATPAMVALTAGALGMIGTDDAVMGLLESLESGRWPALTGSFQSALGQVRDEQGVGLIGEALRQASDDRLKRNLIQALARGQSPAAVKHLARFIKGTASLDLRAQGVSALGAVGNAEAVRIVLDLAKRDGPLMNVAQHSLRNAHDKTLLPDLVRSLDEARDPRLERSLLVAIGSLGDRSATPRIVRTLQTSTSVDTQIAAVQALGKMKDPGASAVLGKTLRGGGHVNLRVQAARALERIGDPKNIAVLESVLEQDVPASLKAVVNYSINRLKMKVPPKPRGR